MAGDLVVTFRTWAAVRVDGVVRAEIRDFTSRAEWNAWTFSGDEVRWWCVGGYEPGEDPNEDADGRREHDDGCGPGAACAKCERQARRWWVEWAKRKAVEAAKAELAPAPDPAPRSGPKQAGLFGGR